MAKKKFFFPFLIPVLGFLALPLSGENKSNTPLIRETGKAREILRKKSGDPILRRAAFRFLLKQETRKDSPLLRQALNDPDSVIRKRCVYELYTRHGEKALPLLLTKVKDPDPQVMQSLLIFGKDMKNKGKSLQLLQELAKKSRHETIRRKADQLANFNFHRINQRLRDSKAHDFELTNISILQLPLTNWKFRADPFGNGHKKKFYSPSFNDTKWRNFKIGYWEEQGYNGYDGFAWYRVRFKAPAKPDCKAVELAFGAVDESAWVWLNGIYIGQHDLGVSGWNKPFWLDVTEEIQWGKENILVVRVQDTIHGGGIWKPIKLEIVK